MMTFLYTWCPDVCPLIAGNLNTALRSPTAKQAGLRVLSVSVDPKRDTPAAVAQVRPRPPAAADVPLGCSARQRSSAQVWRAYKIVVMPGREGHASRTRPCSC